ncbi:hypothetical protein [Nannocystis bainbridge]|uniref:Myxococcus cysteine-rich repeat-containing protein n=1 Tax=Nannocystis bainbridge TaxID=2995303 RepID=A0ABT5EC30_9BACT|nr:hypothetical protein [Nannocystis bainbridge]MDC0722463.1 hypothetical protein [Nannocystis bainbridge]
MPASDGQSASGGPTSFDPPAASDAVEPTTTEAGSTSEASTSATGATAPDQPVCGDDVAEGLEECDLGKANADNGACTLECKLATCGDGLVWEGVEQCDMGGGNSDEYGGCRPDTCHWAARCGDGILDADHELCDRGELNGTGITEDEFAPCDLACGFFGRPFFITSQMFTGALGGVSGADLKCRTAAAKAGLPNATSYRAWISDDFQSPATRFEQWDLAVPLILVGGVVVADDLLDLVDNGPHTGIARTETGQAVAQEFVWTNTSAFGEIFNVTDHCDGWLSASPAQEARQGLNSVAVEQGPDWDSWRDERWWTSSITQECDRLAHLYCIDDGFVLEQER